MSNKEKDAVNELAKRILFSQNIIGFFIAIGMVLFVITAAIELSQKMPSSTMIMLGIMFAWIISPFFIYKLTKSRIIKIVFGVCWFLSALSFKYVFNYLN